MRFSGVYAVVYLSYPPSISNVIPLSSWLKREQKDAARIVRHFEFGRQAAYGTGDLSRIKEESEGALALHQRALSF